jgi:hypothetical protein
MRSQDSEARRRIQEWKNLRITDWGIIEFLRRYSDTEGISHLTSAV